MSYFYISQVCYHSLMHGLGALGHLRSRPGDNNVHNIRNIEKRKIQVFCSYVWPSRNGVPVLPRGPGPRVEGYGLDWDVQCNNTQSRESFVASQQSVFLVAQPFAKSNTWNSQYIAIIAYPNPSPVTSILAWVRSGLEHGVRVFLAKCFWD